jgi:hypothetical protein
MEARLTIGRSDGRLGVSSIILLSLDVRLHVGRRHQANGVAKRQEFVQPMATDTVAAVR